MGKLVELLIALVPVVGRLLEKKDAPRRKRGEELGDLLPEDQKRPEDRK